MTSTHALIFLFVLICASNVLSSVDVEKAKKDEEASLKKIYSEMNKKFKNLINDNLKTFIRDIGDKRQEFNLSAKCMGNTFKLLSGLRDLKIWAVSFMDASGKLSDGFLSGNFHMLGNYDQCLNSSVLKKNGEVDFRGQYCLITTGPNLPSLDLRPEFSDRISVINRVSKNLTDVMRLYLWKSEVLRIRSDKFGLCTPSGCDISDIQQLIQYAGKEFEMDLTVDFCETEESIKYFYPIRIVMVSIYSFFILLLLIGSAIDQYSRVKKITFKNPLIRSLLCFSVITNFPKFMSTEVTDKNLTCMNGIRVLSLFYIILGHHYFLKVDSFLMRNGFSTFVQWVKELFFQIVINGIFTVDVFFFMGGFLNFYIRAKKNFSNFSVSSVFMILLHRLFRLYPVLITTYLMLFLINPRGPMTHELYDKFQKPCETEWWKNILFINNFYDGVNQCFNQTWYLSCDMQYFLLSLLTIPLLFKKPKAGVWLHSAIVFISVLYTGIRAYVKNSPPTLILSTKVTESNIREFNRIFQFPATHSASYFGGILLAFFLTRKRSFKISKIIQLIGWITAGTMFCTVLFMTKRWNAGTEWTRLGSALYFSLSRPLYSWSVGWIIFCCFTGQGGVINYILSLRVWIPLNRLCLTSYLLSPVLQVYYFGNLRTAMDTQTDIEIWNYFGDIVISSLVSIPFVLLFESPFIGLEKIIFHTKPNTSETKENEMNGKVISLQENDIKNDKEKNSIKV